MLDILVNTETGVAKPSLTAVIKAGGGVPVRLTFTSSPGDSPAIELALSPQSSSPAVKAYLSAFDAQSETVYTGVLDANDTRLIALLAGKATQTLDCEIVVTAGDAERQPYPNFPVVVQAPIITGPASSEGGPVYVTTASGDTRYLRASQALAEIAAAGSASQSAARVNLGILAGAPVNMVAVPSASTTAGAPGDFAVSALGLYLYTGDGETHSWLLLSGATSF